MHDPPWDLEQGYAFVEFEDRAEAEQAQLYLDGGQVSVVCEAIRSCL